MLVGLVIAIDIVNFFPGTGMLALWALGRDGCCDAGSAWGAWDHLARRAEAIERNTRGAERVRDEGPLTLWKTLHGEFWAPSRDRMGFVPLLAEQEMRVYGKVRPGDVVIDAGANIGDFTRAALADGARLVVAIEIAPDTLEALRRNLAAEILAGRVIVYDKGVWDGDSEMTLSVSGERGSGVDTLIPLTGEYKPAAVVKLTSIDKIVAELGISQVDLIKLDVEGAELRAVRGARETIRRFKPVLAFDSEDFRAAEVTAIAAELGPLDARYRVRSTVCIYYHAERRLRADAMRFEVDPR